ncbi:unnamed protein product [Protopolystoma xenopodis]|uniref:Uncharacterized protein n=1 Tax=Protopolystoma xenopodis TaxID=117903 RepID=A0A3S5FEF4_9PLAT|nr:unnamed protein product [Protopolystoma xenopodis]
MLDITEEVLLSGLLYLAMFAWGFLTPLNGRHGRELRAPPIDLMHQIVAHFLDLSSAHLVAFSTGAVASARAALRPGSFSE